MGMFSLTAALPNASKVFLELQKASLFDSSPVYTAYWTVPIHLQMHGDRDGPSTAGYQWRARASVFGLPTLMNRAAALYFLFRIIFFISEEKFSIQNKE